MSSAINLYVYKNLCRELEIDSWPEVEEKLEAENVSQVLDAAIMFKDSILVSKKADREYETFMEKWSGVSKSNEILTEQDLLVKKCDVMTNRQNRFRSKLMVTLFGGEEIDYGELSDWEFD